MITMRENVYQKTLSDLVGEAEDLQKYVQRLEIGAPSYDLKQRKEMLQRWANVMDCSWWKDEELRNIVLIEIEKNKKLPTPFNIYDFCLSTRINGLNSNVKDKDKLIQLVQKFSQKTAIRFGS